VAARAPVDLEESAAHADPIAPGEAEREQRRGRGRGRRLETEVIQADIRLYPGNSGGPLADARGRVVGINAMVVGGLGFAIPSRTVQAFLADTAHATTRPYLGIQVLTAPISPALRARLGVAQPSAALITAVEVGSPAEKAGALVGDILLAVNGQTVADAEHLLRVLGRIDASGGAPITLGLLRGGARLELALTPELRAAA
jgi:serine protease Do